jgi:hypothetical protein
MMSTRLHWLWPLLFLVHVEVLAGPFCPEGYRPQGTSFAYTCISNITGQPLDGGAPAPASRAPSPPPIQGHLEAAWGALVWDPDMLVADYKKSLYFGVAMAHRSRQAAIDDATSQCENDGGKRCVVQAIVTRACLGLAGAKGQLVWATQKFTGDVLATSARAGANALAKCQEKGHQQCEVIYSDCSINNWVGK